MQNLFNIFFCWIIIQPQLHLIKIALFFFFFFFEGIQFMNVFGYFYLVVLETFHIM